MNAPFQTRLTFDAVQQLSGEPLSGDEEILILDLDGYEGPLHVLLALAQGQKVDLLKISVTKLVDQYLGFVRHARTRRFAVAADYLVMAAWLAYLKSRLLLPKPARADGDEPPAQTVAAQLAFRLAKLDAVRLSYERLDMRHQLKRDVFTRGDPQATVIVSYNRLEGDLYGLMEAYISQRRRDADRQYSPLPPACYRLDDARDDLRALLPTLTDWTALRQIAPRRRREGEGPSGASYLASTLSAGLEFVREGALDARQLEPYADIYLRATVA